MGLPDDYFRRLIEDPLYLHCGTCRYFAPPQHEGDIGYCERKDSPTFADWPKNDTCLAYWPDIEGDDTCK